ncbi:Radical SAM domain protein [Rhodovulum sulfidophilum]|uniref:Radical SAM domain protein n=1 Tax=Rhodovulum sulfidophilum TaxID=35806 RepID=A0A0D6B961_RHOSU|nr:Radical SAM domain protein [Rhodovulum sulfidophilum]
MSPISETGRLAGIEAILIACPEPTYHHRTGSVCIARISGETVLSAGSNAAATAPGPLMPRDSWERHWPAMAGARHHIRGTLSGPRGARA